MLNEFRPTKDFHCDSAGKESACNVGDVGSIPGLGRSPREGKGYPLQYSGLENSIGCIVHGVAKSQTQLSDFLSLTHSLLGGTCITHLQFSELAGSELCCAHSSVPFTCSTSPKPQHLTGRWQGGWWLVNTGTTLSLFSLLLRQKSLKTAGGSALNLRHQSLILL